MAYSAVILAESSLVGYWRLDDLSGTVADDAQNINDGSYVGTPTLAEPTAIYSDAGKSVRLNGTSQYVNVPDINALDLGDGPLSLEIWVKFATINDSTSRKIIDKGAAYGMRYSGSGKRIAFTTGSTIIANFNPLIICDGNWHHLVATKNGASVKCWFDGRDATGTVTNSTLANNATSLRFGATSTPSEFFNGWLDEAAIYNSVLSADQVWSHYAAGKVPFDLPTNSRKRLRGGLRPGGQWRPGSDASPFNKPIRSGPTLHSNSAAYITKVTGWGAPANLVINNLPTEVYHPIYYPTAGDPLYTITQGTSPNSSDYYGTQIRIPQAAKPAQGSDRHLCSIQPDGTCWDLYDVTESPMTPGGGNVTVRGAQKTTVHGDLRRIGVGTATAAAFSLPAGVIRIEELLAGYIPHRLFMVVKSTDGTQVYPSQGLAGATDPTNAPPNGALFQLNMSDATIDGLSTTWYNKVIFKAMAHYGLQVGDTGGSSWGIQIESGQGYAALGKPDPWLEFARRNEGDGAMTWSAASDTFAWSFNNITWSSNLRVLDPSEA